MTEYSGYNPEQDGSNSEWAKEHTLDVKRVDEDEFFNTKDMLETGGDLQTIQVGKWIETDLQTPVANTGAAYCVEIYAVSPNKNKLIVGHFPETQGENGQSHELQDSVNEYKSMLAKIKEASAADPDTEVYLFGQDHTGTQYELNKKAALSNQMVENGVNPRKLIDERIVQPGGTDSTLFDPLSRTILHKRAY